MYVHSATDMLTIRGNMLLSIQGGGGIAPGGRGLTQWYCGIFSKKSASQEKQQFKIS